MGPRSNIKVTAYVDDFTQNDTIFTALNLNLNLSLNLEL